MHQKAFKTLKNIKKIFGKKELIPSKNKNTLLQTAFSAILPTGPVFRLLKLR